MGKYRVRYKNMTKYIFIVYLLLVTCEVSGCLSSHLLPQMTRTLKSASVRTVGDTLIVSTGRVERRWVLDYQGLRTVSLKDLSLGKEWCRPDSMVGADWNLPGAINRTTKAEFVSQEIRRADDDGFINDYLEVVTCFRYDSARLELQHVVWVFPNASGVRTQLRVRALKGFCAKGLPQGETTRNYFGNTMVVPSARTEYLPLDYSIQNRRRYWGYYNDPGTRHDQSKDMLREEIVEGYPLFQNEDIHWASGVSTEYGKDGWEGVITVKESHKCVNQQGHYTGSFYAGPQGLSVTGWGLTPSEIVEDRFRECWATWTIVFSGGNDGMQLALKSFDRIRYPVFPKRDIMIINDTWGPANPGGAQFAKEDYLLKEIPLLAELGIDVLRIDDGWQINPWGGEKEVFLPSYPDKWKNITEACRRNGLKLGLWVAIQRAKQDDLLKNLREAQVVTWKVDFDRLKDRTSFENRFKNIRQVMKSAWMKTQFSFCPEYADPRYGWYYAKEYGSIYFQNIQEALPEHLIMVPYHVLRQHWLMCKYFNSNKLQVLLQNPKRVDNRYSDAPLHRHDYCFAMGLPFIPVFFQSAQYLDEEGRCELKKLISVYREYREKMFQSYTFPVGETPSNGSWSGFQMIDEDMSEGFFLLFRELYNAESEKVIQMKFLAGKSLKIENLRTGRREEKVVDAEGNVRFSIPDAADFLFLRFRVIK